MATKGSNATLTDKQEKFTEEYLTDLNATRAYKAAYPNCKSDETAAAAGARLLRNVKVKEYIEQKLTEIASERIADTKEVMEYLTAVMRREHKEYVVVTLKEEDTKYVPDENGTMRKQTVKTEVPKVVEIPAKLSDANKAAELLGKRYGLFTDKVKVEGSVGVEIIDDIE